jgi:hypothetical protein
MTVVELRPHPVDINVWAGAPVSLEFTATLDAVAVDLSGASIVAQVLTATGVEATTFGQTISGAGDNVLTLALTGVKTTALLTSLAGSPGRVSVTVDGFPWLGGSISIFPPGSAKAQPSFERTFAVTTGDGLAIAVEVIGGAGGGGAVDSVNGATGVVVLDADDIDDTSTTNKFATAAQLSAVDGLAATYQPLDADLTTLAAGNIPTNLNASLASQYVLLADADRVDGEGPVWDESAGEWVSAPGGVEVLDEDDFASDSATAVPSQQSTKAYVDASSVEVLDEDDFASDSATAVATQQSTKAYVDAATAAAPAAASSAPDVVYPDGVYFTSQGYYITNTITLNDRMYMQRVYLPAGYTVTGLAIRATTQGGAGSVCRLGIYNDAAGVPSTLLVDAGTVDTSTTGAKEATISQLISTSGWYWLACVSQVGTAPILCRTRLTDGSAGGITGAFEALATHAYGRVKDSVTGALPNPAASITSGVSADPPRMVFKGTN